ncbi:hypothetical protein FNF28_04260 [Cafeteria roenbergensis]|uniref:Flap endonuclease 1 n=1 Tax=Cafeteria roenbergensis TaxID=33653 RepID=A0A5A8DGL3_CAFRO|nr:hypothetical protein FNF28_04260 [Cafeteria roenbergensis]
MGIKNLMKLIQASAPAAVKEITLKELLGRKVAIDASMTIYSFLVAVRSSSDGAPSANLTNEAGEVTSHLQGIFSRTIRLMEHGVRPVYVFDGKPPTLKSGELAKRKEAKEKAKIDLEAAQARIAAAGEDDAEAAKEAVAEAEKLAKRTVHMQGSHQEEAKHLLRLMGVPVVEAPCEAEAQCAALAKAGVVWAAATEDMDTLCFGTPRLLRRLTFSEARKLPVWEISLPKLLADLGLSMDQFVDVCILCGCDYLEPLKGIGPVKALERVRKHGDLAAVIEALREEGKVPVPEGYPIDEALRLFHEADITDPETLRGDIKWTAPDEAGLVEYLVDQKGFNADRVRNAIERLKKARAKGGQKRMDSFFTMGAKAKAAPAAKKGAAKPKSAAAKPARRTSASVKAGAATAAAAAAAASSAGTASPVAAEPSGAVVAAPSTGPASPAATPAEGPAGRSAPEAAATPAPVFFAASRPKPAASKRSSEDMDSAETSKAKRAK